MIISIVVDQWQGGLNSGIMTVLTEYRAATLRMKNSV